VADFYYELHDGAVSIWGAKYHVVYSITGDAMQAGGYDITQHSNRIWCEQGDTVWYVKNRFTNVPDVDLKEFMWIKLKSQTLRGR
jgi:hypothetical protein